MKLDWAHVSALEYPPHDLTVWTSDGLTVRKGTWHWEPPDMPLEDGIWNDESGDVIKVRYWTFLEDSPDGPPPLESVPKRRSL